VLALVALAGVAVTFTLFLLARQVETRRLQEDLARKVELTGALLQRELDEPLHLLRSIEGFFLSSRDVSRVEFWGFNRDALALAPSVHAVEWIPRVPQALRARHEADARTEGFPLYQIADVDDRGRLTPAPRRAQYLPIAYAEAAGAARARLELGRDLAVSPTDLAAMTAALETGRQVAGVPFPHLEGTNLHYRCRVFASVFTNLVAHDTLEQRRRNYAGYAAAVLELQPLFDGALRRLPALERQELTWQLLDDSVRGAAPVRLYQSVRWIGRAPAGLGSAIRFPMGGRSWVLHGRPTSRYLAAIHARHSGWVVVGGLLGTVLLLGYLSSVLGRAALVERWVEERTAALDRTNTELRQEINRRRETETALEQERYLANALLDSIPDHIYFKDRASRFLRINRSMAQRFQLGSPAEAVGKTDFDFFTAEHAQSAFADEQEILRTGVAMVGGEEAETWPDGTTTWVSSTKQCLRDKDGNVVGTYGLSRDITSRKRAERRLSVQYQVAQILAGADTFEAAAPRILEEVGRCLGWTFGSVWLVDATGQALRCVESWSAPETPVDEFESNSRSMTMPKGVGLPGRVLAGGEPVWIEDVVIDPNFPRASLALKAGLHGAIGFPFRSAGEILGVMEFFSRRIEKPDEDLVQMFSAIGSQIGQFVTRKRMERALQEKAEELERSNQDLEQFAYVASHDLQEPLRMISSYTQLLGRRYGDKLDADAHEFIRFAVEGSARLQALINDLLAYSRVGTRPRAFAETSMGEVLNRALKNLEIAVEESHARITSDPMPVVHGDAIQLTQLLQNLLGNALKFRGTKPAAIHVGARREPGSNGRIWHFSVQDHGIGIAPEYFERIFVLFQRLHSREEYPGTGIGLAICKKIVERHGGRIWVESQPGQGTTFHFTIPEL
jgi:PAS domain S-box-containing protein